MGCASTRLEPKRLKRFSTAHQTGFNQKLVFNLKEKVMEMIRERVVYSEVAGDRAVVQFVKDGRTSMSTVKREGEPRTRIVIGDKPFWHQGTDARFVRGVTEARPDGVAGAVDVVREQYSRWQELDQDGKIDAERNFGGILEAARARADISAFTPAEADMIFDMHTARMDAFARNVVVPYGGTESGADAPAVVPRSVETHTQLTT